MTEIELRYLKEYAAKILQVSVDNLIIEYCEFTNPILLESGTFFKAFQNSLFYATGLTYYYESAVSICELNYKGKSIFKFVNENLNYQGGICNFNLKCFIDNIMLFGEASTTPLLTGYLFRIK